MAAEQIGKNDNQQPEPHDEEEYPQDIHQEISIGETFLKEEHGDPPLRASAATPKSHYLLRQTALFDLNQLFLIPRRDQPPAVSHLAAHETNYSSQKNKISSRPPTRPTLINVITCLKG